MFSGIGIWEVLLIIVVVFIVLGPRRVPEIARKLGQIVRTIKRASTDLSTAITRELDVTKDNSSTPGEKPGPAGTPPDPATATGDKNTQQPPRPEGRRESHE